MEFILKGAPGLQTLSSTSSETDQYSEVVVIDIQDGLPANLAKGTWFDRTQNFFLESSDVLKPCQISSYISGRTHVL